MKHYKKILMTVILTLTAIIPKSVDAQAPQHIRMDSTTNNIEVSYNGNSSLIISDDDSQTPGEHYIAGADFQLTVSGLCTIDSLSGLKINMLDISRIDTLFIHDGPDITAPVRARINNTTGYDVGDYILTGPNNPSGKLTLRFYTNPRLHPEEFPEDCRSTGRGFVLESLCGSPCTSPIPSIDTIFYRLHNGKVYDSVFLKWVAVYDTTRGDPCLGEPDSIMHIDTNWFLGANLCLGDGIAFKAHVDYGHFRGPSDSTTFFIWDMDNKGDTLRGLGVKEITYDNYRRLSCHDLTLSIIDEYGCLSNRTASVRIRTAGNPIKTLFTLPDICNRDSLLVNMGYDGDNALLTLRHIRPDSIDTKQNNALVFIPDGGTNVSSGCPSRYYEAPVEFTEFPNQRVLTKGEEICSICINIEHSFMGDIALSIVCPTGQEAFLKYGQYTSGRPSGPGSETGGSTYLGFPIEDGIWDNNPTCDATVNPYGIGQEYCFSRNRKYTLVTGDSASFACDGRPNGNYYIGSSGYLINKYVTFPPVPPVFIQAGQIPPSRDITTKQPSNHVDSTNYYLPYSNFSELIGCPLNGVWNLRVYDDWGHDNGWVFGWNMDICSHTDCTYEVGIDSLVWYPDSNSKYHDYDMGHYRGLESHSIDSTSAYLLSPDTAGTFPVKVLIYDDFGCIWDTTTTITTIWTPQPSLGPDTILCGDLSLHLDATDAHTSKGNYSYLWHPTGSNSSTYNTPLHTNEEISYVVQVTNTYHESVCTNRDTILVRRGIQPTPAFLSYPANLEGCEPFTVRFENLSTDAVSHLWFFGDGTQSSQPNPVHTFSSGQYNMRYYTSSIDGCTDSVIVTQAISVFPSPKAAFTWDPTYPSALQPLVTFHNLTSPNNPNNKYFWELQYDPNNPLSFQTLTSHDARFNYADYNNGSELASSYNARLIARTDNLAPSGHTVYCSDTSTNTILVLNNFLQFPNVVSPNGDGVNDRFVITGLLEGNAYPVNSLDIYNAWGVMVFHRENISSPNDFWDPAGLPSGTYYFRFSGHGYNGAVEHNGVVEVLSD